MLCSNIAKRFAFAWLLLPALSACSEPASKPISSRTVPFPKQPPAELGEKWRAEYEAGAEEIVATVEQLLRKRFEGEPFLRRDAHPRAQRPGIGFIELGEAQPLFLEGEPGDVGNQGHGGTGTPC